MTCSDAPVLTKPSVKSEPACSCGDPNCEQKRVWKLSLNVPVMDSASPVVGALTATVGLDGIQVIGKYTILTKVAEAFDELVVMQSVKENISGLPAIDVVSGHDPAAKPEPRKAVAPKTEAESQEYVLKTILPQVLEQIGDYLYEPTDEEGYITDGEYLYMRTWPLPEGMSWWRRLLMKLARP